MISDRTTTMPVRNPIEGAVIMTGIALVILVGLVSPTTPAAASDADDGLSSPADAYDALEAAVESNDLEAFKALMSSKLENRLNNEYYLAEGLRSGAEYLEKVPKEEPQIEDSTAVYSKTYDEEKLIATYSVQFVNEDGRWLFDGYKTSTRSK